MDGFFYGLTKKVKFLIGHPYSVIHIIQIEDIRKCNFSRLEIRFFKFKYFVKWSI